MRKLLHHIIHLLIQTVAQKEVRSVIHTYSDGSLPQI